MRKDELMSALEDSREELLAALEGISSEEVFAEDSEGEWTLKDLLAQLVMWEAETIKLHYQVRRGMPPATVHFKDSPADEQDRIWRAQTKDRALERVLADFYAIRGQTLRRLDDFNDRELNDPARFPWLRGKALSQIVEDTVLVRERELAEMIRVRRSRQAG
jgi:hypothetical protein